MAVTPADLLAPAGPVEDTLFPEEGDGTAGTDLYDRLNTYINRAVQKIAGIAFPDPDAATTAWALHLTFEAAYLVAISRPASEDSKVEILGSQQYAKDQRDALRMMADEYLDTYRRIAASVPATSQPAGLPSRQITNTFEW